MAEPPAEDLLGRAWDENTEPFTKTVQVTISRLRRKLGDPPPIQTITGVGYRITEPSHQPPTVYGGSLQSFTARPSDPYGRIGGVTG